MDNKTSHKSQGTSPACIAEVVKDLAPPGSFKPEWLRIPEATRRFGIGRSSLYELINEGKIKSVSVRKRGNVRGIRLISAPSVEAYLDSLLATAN